MAAGKELFKLWGLLGMQGVEIVEKDLKKIDKQVRKTQKEFDRLGRRVSNTGKVLTKALTLPLLVVGAAVTKFRADFDAALTESMAIMGDLSDTMKKDLRDTAVEVSKVTSFSAKQAAKAYFFLASAGKTAAQSIGLLPLVAKFAQAGNFDLARATDLLTDAQSALGLSSKDTVKDMENMNRVSDVLVKANTLANATVSQFSESLTNKAGAALRVLNKDIEEGVAVLAVFADQGLKGAASGDALNIVLRDMQKAALKEEEAFKRANVAVFDQNGKMRNMADIIGDLEGLLLGMSDKQRRATLTMLGFQDKSISATMTLLGTSEAIKEYEKGLRKAAGITDEVSRKQLDTFWKKLGLLKDRLIAVGLTTEVMAGVSNRLLIPALEKIVSMVERVNNWFNRLSPSMQKTVKGFILIAAVIGPVVFLIGKLIVLSKVFIPLLVALKTGTLSWSAAMATLQKSALGVTLVIGALVALGWYWVSQWDTMSVQLKAVWAKISREQQKMANDMLQTLTNLSIKAIDLLLKISGAVPGLTDKLNKSKVAILRFKAALFEKLGKHQAYTNAINDSAEANKSFTDTLKGAIDAGKKALGLKEEEIEKIKKKKTLTEEEIKKAEAAAKKRAQFDQDILKQMKKLGADKFELLAIEREAAVKEAEKLGADVLAVKKLYSDKEKELLAEDEKARQEFNQRTRVQTKQFAADKLGLLEIEKQEALQKADELGADKEAINTLYALREQDLRDKLRKEGAAKDKEDLKKRISQAFGMGNKLSNIFSKFSDNKFKRIEFDLDKEEKKKIEAIENSRLTEEEKELALEKIAEEMEVKRQAIAKRRAKREKMAALFSIAINTASAIVEALPNIPLSVAVGLLGLAEGVSVNATPEPFFEGGLVEGSERGVNALVGDRGQDELVFPLETGIGLFIDGLMERLGEIELPTFGAAPALAGAAGPAGDINLHVGVLVADERGLKELERRLDTVRIAENQRKGFV